VEQYNQQGTISVRCFVFRGALSDDSETEGRTQDHYLLKIKTLIIQNDTNGKPVNSNTGY